MAPKVGRNAFAQNLLPLLTGDGLDVLGVDLDPQETLAKSRGAGGLGHCCGYLAR
jgi:hypothetical protein